MSSQNGAQRPVTRSQQDSSRVSRAVEAGAGELLIMWLIRAVMASWLSLEEGMGVGMG